MLLLSSFCSFVFCFHQHLLSKMMEFLKISSSSTFQRIRDDLENQMSHCKLRSLIWKYILLRTAFFAWVGSEIKNIYLKLHELFWAFYQALLFGMAKQDQRSQADYNWPWLGASRPDRMTRCGHKRSPMLGPSAAQVGRSCEFVSQTCLYCLAFLTKFVYLAKFINSGDFT